MPSVPFTRHPTGHGIPCDTVARGCADRAALTTASVPLNVGPVVRRRGIGGSGERFAIGSRAQGRTFTWSRTACELGASCSVASCYICPLAGSTFDAHLRPRLEQPPC
jgi:hypothetical protein